jgi:RNA-binding protein YhbY
MRTINKPTGEVLLQVGKNGITDNTYLEVLKNIKKGRPVRVKLLNNFLGSSDRFKASTQILSGIEGKAKFRSKLTGNILFIEPLRNVKKSI